MTWKQNFDKKTLNRFEEYECALNVNIDQVMRRWVTEECAQLNVMTSRLSVSRATVKKLIDVLGLTEKYRENSIEHVKKARSRFTK